jgi:UDP-N-acetylmuramoyl-L-alanyl-D-glutamate--2,6-diaminopimelate ligase
VKLKTLIEACSGLRGGGGEDPEITMISADSRRIEPGGLFMAVGGYREDGFRYVEKAVSRGAAVVVVDESRRGDGSLPKDVPVCFTSSPRRTLLEMARAFYGRPAESLTLTGITGTNGKTTVTYLLERIFRDAGFEPGIIGTVNYRYGGEVLKADNTTPDPVVLQGLLARMRDAGVSHAVMEVSSHALAMDRVDPGEFDHALFTNLSQDHLDFHRDMEDYFQAKARLFSGLRSDAAAVINLDDGYGERMAALTPSKIVTYGFGPAADVRCTDHRISLEGSEFAVGGVRYRTSLPGVHNIYNILGAIALATFLGIGEEVMRRSLSRLKSIPGRFERVGEDTPYYVFVDYAHTPDALENLLTAAKALRKARVITVFGCGGDRDRKKRPKMGRIVENLSDICVVTSDNPRTEDPLAIIEEIKAGMTGTRAVIIPDRREAIHRAVGMAAPGDIVLVAGKGHEDYQILGARRIHFDDREIVREAIEAR